MYWLVVHYVYFTMQMEMSATYSVRGLGAIRVPKTSVTALPRRDSLLSVRPKKASIA